MSDTTDLSKLTSTELIAKIVNLALDCGGRWECVWTSEANAKLHALTVILKQAIIREASVGTYVHACDFPAEDVVYMNNDKALPVADYWLIPKETP